MARPRLSVVVALALAIACQSESTPFGTRGGLGDALRQLDVGRERIDPHVTFARVGGAYAFGPEAHAGARIAARIDDDCGLYVRDARRAHGVRLRPVDGPLRTASALAREGTIVCEDARARGGVALTVTARGVKEDIVLRRPLQGPLTFAWDLAPEGGLAAHKAANGDVVLRDAAGDGGRALYRLPAPIVRDANGRTHADVARFALEDAGGGTAGGRYRIRIVTDDLSALAYPISIDPSVIVTLTADFSSSGSVEAGETIANDELARSGLSHGVASWTAATAMNRARLFHASVAQSGHVYAIGGCGDTACSTVWSDVEMAPIQPDGSLGTWSFAGPAFGAARYHHAAVAAQGYIYVAGGAGLQDVLYSKVGSDGTPGTWFSATPLPVTLFGHTLVAQGGKLYVLGGVTGGPNATIYRADMHADGSLGAWTLDASTLPGGGRYYQSGFAADDRIVLGGGWFSGPLGDAITAKLNADGSVGSWFTASANAYTSPLYQAGTYFHGEYYTTGGCNGTSCTTNDIATVYQRPVSPSGTLGPAMTTTPMSSARYGHTLVAYGDRLYATGGVHNGAPLASTEYATAGSPVVDMAASIAGGGLSASRTYHMDAAYSGYLYVAGGVDGTGTYQNTVLVSSIGAGGLNSPFAASPQTLSTGRMGGGAVAANGRLYVIGGSAQTFPFLRGDVQFAPLAADGSLGTFQNGGPNLNTARGSFATVGYNDHLYVVSGGAGSSDLADVEYTSIFPDGTVGPWLSSAQTLAAQWTGRSGVSSFVHDRKLYVLGGCSASCTTWPTDVWSATILSDGSIDTSTWANVGSLPAGIPNGTHYAFAAQNGYVYGVGSPLGQGTVLYAPIADDGTISAGAWQSTNESLQWPTGPTSRMLAYNGNIYALGGRSGAGYGTVILAETYAPGGFGAWTADRALPEARFAHASATTGRYLYVVGGIAGGVSSAVRYAAIGADGSLGTWQTGPSLGTARAYASAFAFAGKLYVLGGENGGELASIEEAPLDPATGAPGAFTTLATSLGAGRARHAAVVNGRTVYVLGGRTSGVENTDVLSSDIAPDGSLGPFVVRSSFSTARSRLAAFAYDGRIFVGAGAASDGSPLADIQSAPFQANGALGSFTFWGALDHGRVGPFADARNGHLRFVGGKPATGYWGETQYAPMYSGGRIGHWAGGANLGVPREMESTATDGAFVWVTGGQDGSGPLTSVQRCAIGSIDAVGSYARTVDLGPYATTADAIIVGGSTSSTGKVRVQYRTADAGGIFGALTDLHEVPLGVAMSLGPVSARYVWARVIADDTRSFHGSVDGDTTPRDVTDITVLYSDPCTNVTCQPLDQCHDAGTCDPATGTCSNPAKADGSSCNDGNACTQTDTCQLGTCAGANPVGCNPLDACHSAGTCDPSTGICSNPTKPDGTSCSDGNACTQTDTCQAGTCTGANPVVCAASDACHSAGTCNSSTGLCSNPTKPDGTSCSDGNACTQTDTCQAGTCTGANPVLCAPLDSCHVAGTCDAVSGACSNPAAPDGTACPGGTCQAGSCIATPPADAGGGDAAATDAGSGTADAANDAPGDGAADTGGGDAGAGASDSGATDSGADAGTDSGATDSGASDSGAADSGAADSGVAPADAAAGDGSSGTDGGDASTTNDAGGAAEGGTDDSGTFTDAGADAASSPDAGESADAADTDGAIAPDGATASGSTDGAPSDDGGAGAADTGADGGCSCRTPGGPRGATGGWGALVALALVFARRRRGGRGA